MIGIISRLDITPNKHEAYIIYKAFNDIASNYDQIVIGILPNKLDNIKKVIDNCDGIILQGGSDYTNLDLEIVKYIYDKDIPCLGICLGMQTMCMLFDGKIDKVKNHYNNYHEVLINNSNIYENGYIIVNSRHHDCITKTIMQTTGLSRDNIIEMVEKKNRKFFVGVQWHPENMYKTNSTSKLLFDKFFDIVKNGKKML